MRRNTSFDVGANISPETGRRPTPKFDVGPNPPSREPSLHKGNNFGPGSFAIPVVITDEANANAGGMRRNDSFSWMWKWDLSPTASQKASNAPSREGSQHSGNAFGGMARVMSLNSLWNWKGTPAASPASSREASAHGGKVFASPLHNAQQQEGNGFVRNFSFLWNWARFRGDEEEEADPTYPQADVDSKDAEPVPEGMPKDFMWSWGVGRPSPTQSRDASQHAGSLWSNNKPT